LQLKLQYWGKRS